MFDLPTDLPADLAPLSWLVGVWEGSGVIDYADHAFTGEFTHRVSFSHDGGDYLNAVMKEIVAGTLKEGQTKEFKVGVDPEPGAVICNATPEEQAKMDAVYKEIADGKHADELGAIAAEAFSQG